ncbi:unnamed protein product [Adineta steineri]|uniref:Uncharacterized protein n=1 Tax=Adineta steineri TaxID=433720 RepID=A0A815THX9_9BILA|nr:unnamed protein product [Adineta steineri]CAF1503320.1 unnamed protein product [Adineta steineri]CAF1503369.1 unnamed protein product [Adineta steineri]CAF1503422.1 unnamed protein product [Adineta steineri]CAF1645048.1 unnamed protein product [Adineta steineri]
MKRTSENSKHRECRQQEDSKIDSQSANETVSEDSLVDDQPVNETVQGNYEIDQQLANRIVDKVTNLLTGDKMPSENGVIAIGTMKYGTKIFAYSGAAKHRFVAGSVETDDTITIVLGKAPNVKLKLDELVLYEHITKNLGYTIEDVQTLGGMQNERGQKFPRNPATCAEPRVMVIAFGRGYTKDDFVSIMAFRREPLGVVPEPPCGNCQVTLNMLFQK